MKSIGGTSSMERAGQPAELASIYVQLASTEASYTTSAIYGAAGGIGHPSYQGLREDKPAEQVIREKKKRLNPKAAGPIKFVD